MFLDYNKSDSAMDVEDFQYLVSLIRNNDIRPKLSPGEPCPEQHYKSRTNCYQQIQYTFEDEI